MLTIGEFSSASRLTVKALRIYHDEGLLVPERVDAVNGYRYYGDESFKRAHAIVILRELGFSIAEMGQILSSSADDDDLAQFFKTRLAEIDRELARVRDVREQIRFFIDNGGDDAARHSVGICEKAIEPQWICSIRYRGAYGEIGLRFSELFRKTARYAIGKPFALYYDREYSENADIEAAIPVRKEIAVTGIDCRKLEGGQFAAILHRGPFDRIGFAYKTLFDWLNEHSHALVGPTREVYLKGPGMIIPRDPSRFATEILAPIGYGKT